MLHITDGDSAADLVRKANLSGDPSASLGTNVLPWREVLHEGSVPIELSLIELNTPRVRFLSSQCWTTFEEAMADLQRRDAMLETYKQHDEIVLWFEHCLADQLQLLQALEWFGMKDLGGTKLSLIGIGSFPEKATLNGFGELTVAEMASLFPWRTIVSTAQLRTAQQAWRVFGSQYPMDIEAFRMGDTASLPFLSNALLRHLQQFHPWRTASPVRSSRFYRPLAMACNARSRCSRCHRDLSTHTFWAIRHSGPTCRAWPSARTP